MEEGWQFTNAVGKNRDIACKPSLPLSTRAHSSVTTTSAFPTLICLVVDMASSAWNVSAEALTVWAAPILIFRGCEIPAMFREAQFTNRLAACARCDISTNDLAALLRTCAHMAETAGRRPRALSQRWR